MITNAAVTCSPHTSTTTASASPSPKKRDRTPGQAPYNLEPGPVWRPDRCPIPGIPPTNMEEGATHHTTPGDSNGNEAFSNVVLADLVSTTPNNDGASWNSAATTINLNSNRASGSGPGSLEIDVRRLVRQNEQLLAALRSAALDVSHIPHLPADAEVHRHQQRKQEYIDQWSKKILPHKINDPASCLWGLRPFFQWRKERRQSTLGSTEGAASTGREEPDEDRDLGQIFAKEQLWNSWQYRRAFPRLAKLIASAELGHKTKSAVEYLDFDPSNSDKIFDSWDSTVNKDLEASQAAGCKSRKIATLDHRELWEHIKHRIPKGDIGGKVPCRILRITDLSAELAVLLMGSTPRLDLAYIAPFLERYLQFSNWAMANIVVIPGGGNVTQVNTYLFEYHFAFYYVPSGTMDPGLVDADFRRVRHIAKFDRGHSDRHRFIFEEQLSFILVGHGGDVYTNYQLAEKYYVGPHLKGAEGMSVFVTKTGWKPHTMFLTWISVALHHVSARWQTAIDAIDKQIDSPFHVIFHEEEEKSNLLSDDPSFSRSKTYFWAIQVYKLFEETLSNTISTWQKFKKESLDKVDDGQMPEAEDTIRVIDKAIERLSDQLHRVQMKRQEVIDLREGVSGDPGPSSDV